MSIEKTVNNVKHTYTVEGIKILREQYSNVTLDFLYDVEDEVVGFTYNGTPYYYRKNLQGDVIEITNSSGAVIATYEYDAWGKLLTVTGDTVIASINPIRYRSYYYDTETQLYYLNSRYYDPDTCRFINADDVNWLCFSEVIDNNNLFRYCENDPVNLKDSDGNIAVIDDIAILGIIAVVGLCLVLVWLFNTRAFKNAFKKLGKMLQDVGLQIGESLKKGKKAIKKWLKSLIVYFGFLKKAIALKDVKARYPNPKDRVYQMAYINNSNELVKHYYKMSYFTACEALKTSGTINGIVNKWFPNSKKNVRGVYTKEQTFAKALAIYFGANIIGPEVHKSGEYGHYHDEKRIYHIWFGGIIR